MNLETGYLTLGHHMLSARKWSSRDPEGGPRKKGDCPCQLMLSLVRMLTCRMKQPMDWEVLATGSGPCSPTEEQHAVIVQSASRPDEKLSHSWAQTDDDIRQGTDMDLSELLKIASPDFRSCEDCVLSHDRLFHPMDDLLCSVCKHILNRGVEAPCCKQLFCAECISGLGFTTQHNVLPVDMI